VVDFFRRSCESPPGRPALLQTSSPRRAWLARTPPLAPPTPLRGESSQPNCVGLLGALRCPALRRLTRTYGAGTRAVSDSLGWGIPGRDLDAGQRSPPCGRPCDEPSPHLREARRRGRSERREARSRRRAREGESAESRSRRSRRAVVWQARSRSPRGGRWPDGYN
jgi:hypothetical protein